MKSSEVRDARVNASRLWPALRFSQVGLGCVICARLLVLCNH